MLKSSPQFTSSYLIKQLPSATIFVNKNGIIVHASDRWLTDFKLDEINLINKNIRTVLKHANHEWKKALNDCLKRTSSHSVTQYYHLKNEEKRWFELHSIPWYDTNENIIGTILHAQNVCQRVQSETNLEKLKLISKDISDRTEVGFWDYDLEEDNMFWDERTKAIHEVNEDYVPNILDAINFYKIGNSRNTLSKAINEAISNEASFSEKLQLVTTKGKEIWVITSGKPLYKNGQFSGMVGTVQNVNERTIYEEKRKENERLLRILIDNLPLAVSIKDLESRRILVNKSEMEFFGVKRENDILGKDDFAIFEKEIAEIARKDDLTVMRDLQSIICKEVTFKNLNGKAGTYLVSKIPLIDTDGHAYGLIAIRMNISDLKRKEQELRDLITITSSQNERLINFAHIVSHNLRSHTSNFSMLLNFLSQEKIEEEREKIMEMLIDSSDNLLETIANLNEVVDINIQRDEKIKHVKLLSLHRKIKTIEQSLKADLISSNTTIINSVSSDIKIRVIPAYLDSILNNFMTNAIKYQSPDRNAVVHFTAVKEGAYTVLSITDNGIGIDLEQYGDKIFGMYKTFHGKENSKGIGLYITKNQIEAMNGKVTVTSKVGKGTTFKIYFNDEI